MNRQIKISGRYVLDKVEKPFTGIISFENRENSIYYTWKLNDLDGTFIAFKSRNIDFNQIPVNQDKLRYVEEHAIENINRLRIGRDKIIKALTVETSTSS